MGRLGVGGSGGIRERGGSIARLPLPGAAGVHEHVTRLHKFLRGKKALLFEA